MILKVNYKTYKPKFKETIKVSDNSCMDKFSFGTKLEKLKTTRGQHSGTGQRDMDCTVYCIYKDNGEQVDNQESGRTIGQVTHEEQVT